MSNGPSAPPPGQMWGAPSYSPGSTGSVGATLQQLASGASGAASPTIEVWSKPHPSASVPPPVVDVWSKPHPSGTVLGQTALNPLQWVTYTAQELAGVSGSLADASEEQIISYVTSPGGGGVGGLISDPLGTAATVPPWVWWAGGGAVVLGLAFKFWPKKKGK